MSLKMDKLRIRPIEFGLKFSKSYWNDFNIDYDSIHDTQWVIIDHFDIMKATTLISSLAVVLYWEVASNYISSLLLTPKYRNPDI